MNKQRIPSAFAVAIAMIMLSACGSDSDLDAIAERELDKVQQDGSQEPPAKDAQGEAASGVDLEQYDLVFADEFNAGSLDASKWKTAYQWGTDLVINDELQYYVDTQNQPDFGFSPFVFDGDSLSITAAETPADLKAKANDQSYLSGVITTEGKFSMTYGYIEARVDFPEGQGLWPAIWMLGSEFKELKPQLFVAEYNGAKINSVFHNYNYHDSAGNLRSPGQWQITEAGISKGFHTVAVSWETEELVFYVDGVPRYRVLGENVTSQPMYLIANMAVGGVWAGAPSSQTPLPAEFKIDYIRAYKKKAQ